MINSYPNLYYGAVPLNPVCTMPETLNITYPLNTGDSFSQENNLGEAREGIMDSTYYNYQTCLAASEAAKARERNELKTRIAFLESQVKRYPDNITFAIQLDKARARLRELDRR